MFRILSFIGIMALIGLFIYGQFSQPDDGDVDSIIVMAH